MSHHEITAALWVQYTWLTSTAPNPVTWRTPASWRRRQAVEGERWAAVQAEVDAVAPGFPEKVDAFNAHYGTAACVRRSREQHPPEPAGAWPGWYEPRDMIAIALGAPAPLRRNGMWWHDRAHYPLAEVDAPVALARHAVPDWSRVPAVRRMLANRDRWQRACPDEPPSGFASMIRWDRLVVPGQGEVTTLCYPSFVDLGVYLMGATRFFTVLAGEPALADAFMELCFALSTSYIDFLYTQQPFPVAGFTGFGGDATFFLSPGLYARYSATWDARLFDYVRARHGVAADMPCNYHSCGASAHLYEAWGRHPRLANVTAMQTRLIPGTVGRLRAAMPRVQLELTLHPPEFDLSTAEPAAVRDVLLTSVRDAGGHGVHFSCIAAVHHPDAVPMLARNVQVCAETIAELRGA